MWPLTPAGPSSSLLPSCSSSRIPGCHHCLLKAQLSPLPCSPLQAGDTGGIGRGSKGTVAALACPKATLSLRAQTPSGQGQGTGTSRGGENLQVRQSDTCLDTELKTRVKVQGTEWSRIWEK